MAGNNFFCGIQNVFHFLDRDSMFRDVLHIPIRVVVQIPENLRNPYACLPNLHCTIWYLSLNVADSLYGIEDGNCRGPADSTWFGPSGK